MIEVRIPKEVREYQEKWLLGMNRRQLAGCLLALVVNVPLYFFLRQYLWDELAGWIIVFTSAPFMLIGFYKYQGMPFEKLALCVISFYRSERKRTYITDNVYAWIKAEYEREEENVVRKTKGKETKVRKE